MSISIKVLLQRASLMLSLLLVSTFAHAQVGIYQTHESFLKESFLTEPNEETLWLDEEIKAELSRALDRKYRGLRVRYWHVDGRTSWVLNEIGKERPITTGITVDDNKVVAMSVLEYRESRGGEVRLDAFREQFINRSLTGKNKLDARIDGITGATMSVLTIKRSAIAALKLHRAAINQLDEISGDALSSASSVVQP